MRSNRPSDARPRSAHPGSYDAAIGSIGPHLDRRSFIAGAAALSAALVVVGCSDDGPTDVLDLDTIRRLRERNRLPGE